MSGRWVWVPKGWRVVPMDYVLMPSECMELGMEEPPEPPSGWRQGKWLEEQQVLCYYPNHSPPDMTVSWAPYEDTWWAPLPPPPEVKP